MPVPGMPYNALAHNLKILRFINDNCQGFEYPEGPYESGNKKSAVEILLGDKVLIDFVKGSGNWDDVWEHIKVEEQKWIRKAKKFLLYDEQLFRCK
jgi:hypothetical protein